MPIDDSIASVPDPDTSFEPSSSDSGSDFESDDECANVDSDTPAQQPESTSLFIVAWSSIILLLQYCMVCIRSACVTNILYRGTYINVTLKCIAGHLTTWSSQPLIRKIALGNLRLVCGTVLSGAGYTRIKEICEFSRIRILSQTSFDRIQKNLLRPVVHEFWEKNNKEVIKR